MPFFVVIFLSKFIIQAIGRKIAHTSLVRRGLNLENKKANTSHLAPVEHFQYANILSESVQLAGRCIFQSMHWHFVRYTSFNSIFPSNYLPQCLWAAVIIHYSLSHCYFWLNGIPFFFLCIFIKSQNQCLRPWFIGRFDGCHRQYFPSTFSYAWIEIATILQVQFDASHRETIHFCDYYFARQTLIRVSDTRFYAITCHKFLDHMLWCSSTWFRLCVYFDGGYMSKWWRTR